jgi:hypothetical protein
MKARIPLLSVFAALAPACGGGEVSDDGDPGADSKAAAEALCACMEKERPSVEAAIAQAPAEEEAMISN